MMQEALAYILFILIGVLPTLVPVLAVTLPFQAGWLAMRSHWVIAILCLMLAGYCAALAFGPADGVPGWQGFQDLRKVQERREHGSRMMQSSAFGGTGKNITVGEMKEVYGESGEPRSTEEVHPENRRR